MEGTPNEYDRPFGEAYPACVDDVVYRLVLTNGDQRYHGTSTPPTKLEKNPAGFRKTDPIPLNKAVTKILQELDACNIGEIEAREQLVFVGLTEEESLHTVDSWRKQT